MRTNLFLESTDSDLAWKRIGFVGKPNRRVWQDMAALWKARVEWIDDDSLESDDDAIMSLNDHRDHSKTETTLPHHRRHKSGKEAKVEKVEKLVVGWGDAAWIINVMPGEVFGTGKTGERSPGSIEVPHQYVRAVLMNRLHTNTSIVSSLKIALFLASRSIPLHYFLYLHIGHTTMTTTPSKQPPGEACIDARTAYPLSSSSSTLSLRKRSRSIL